MIPSMVSHVVMPALFIKQLGLSVPGIVFRGGFVHSSQGGDGGKGRDGGDSGDGGDGGGKGGEGGEGDISSGGGLGEV